MLDNGSNLLQARILDPSLVGDLIRQRQLLGIDVHDEVWEGVYVVPPLANNPHQGLVAFLIAILFDVVTLPGRGQVFPGANVSDRRGDWEHNYRNPDVVVVLRDGRAVNCTTHWMGGPDFLVEIQSPGDDTEAKIPFYSQLEVRELLIIHRDTRRLRLLRHDGRELTEVSTTDWAGKRSLVSSVVPLAFRRIGRGAGIRIEVIRTDGSDSVWTI